MSATGRACEAGVLTTRELGCGTSESGCCAPSRPKRCAALVCGPGSGSLGWRVAGLSGMSRLLGLGAEEMGLGHERSGRGGARFGPRMRERRPVGLGYVERGKRAVRGE